MGNFTFDEYVSVFSWRYGSKEMRRIFSEKRQRVLWRKLWSSLAEIQHKYGIVSKEELEDIKAKAKEEYIEISKAHEIEKEIKHDLMAELRVFADQSPIGGKKLHLGATSADIEDNVDIIRMREALNLILRRTVNCLEDLADKILKYKALVCMGYTHLQPAEPTTLGYRFANYALDLILDLELLEFLMKEVLKGKGIKGAVGTSASFKSLLNNKVSTFEFEREVMSLLGLEYFPVSTQTYPRKVDAIILSCLANLAQSCHKFALDLRILQSPNFGEISEPFGEKQVGSSTMAFKRNPVYSERICSLSRFIYVLPYVACFYSSSTIFERTLDDSAARRIVIPEAFLALDEILILYEKILKGLIVREEMIRKNLKNFGLFSGTEALMVKLTELGEDRQRVHELIREISMKAWEKVMKGEENPLLELLKKEKAIISKIKEEELKRYFELEKYVGDAEERCELIVKEYIEPIIKRYKESKLEAVEERF
ncbi:MAG: adenylosuccinate lyase [Nitrososphaerales archaeon]